MAQTNEEYRRGQRVPDDTLDQLIWRFRQYIKDERSTVVISYAEIRLLLRIMLDLRDERARRESK